MTITAFLVIPCVEGIPHPPLWRTLLCLAEGAGRGWTHGSREGYRQRREGLGAGLCWFLNIISDAVIWNFGPNIPSSKVSAVSQRAAVHPCAEHQPFWKMFVIHWNLMVKEGGTESGFAKSRFKGAQEHRGTKRGFG